MITSLILVALVCAGGFIVALSKQNIKLKAELRNKVNDAPVNPAPPVKPIDATVCNEVAPEDSVIMRNDINDIVSLFNYLTMRTKALNFISEDVNPISEVDDFIKENMIDLRDQKGLICTDGHYLLQYGERNSKNKFLLVEMKSPMMIQAFNYKYKQAMFEPYWDKIGVKFLSSLPPTTVRNLIFNEAIYNMRSYIQNKALYFTPFIYLADNIEYPGDPLKQIRNAVNYSLSNTIEHYIEGKLKSIEDSFGKYTEIVGIDENNNYYLAWSCDEARCLIPLDKFTTLIDISTHPGNWLKADDKSKNIFNSISKIKKSISLDSEFVIHDSILGITFHKIKL